MVTIKMLPLTCAGFETLSLFYLVSDDSINQTSKVATEFTDIPHLKRRRSQLYMKCGETCIIKRCV